jgi:tetratricopeptide (TPR) repeat protein
MGGIFPKSLKFIILSLLLFGPTIYGQQEEIAEAIEDLNQPVVTLLVYDSNKTQIAEGKGVIVSSDGLVLTNYHLICRGYSAKARLAGGKIQKKVDWKNVFYPSADLGGVDQKDVKEKKKKPKGKLVNVEGIVGLDKSLDLALLQIKGRGYSVPQLTTSDQFEIGTRALVVVDDEAYSEGAIISLRSLTGIKKIAQISFKLTAEMSGSPLFNPEAQVIGIASYFGENSNFLLPVCYALPLIKKEKITPLSSFPEENFFTTCEGHYLKGMAYAILDDFQRALFHLEQSVQINPHNSHAFSQMGTLCSKLNQYQKAVDAYNQAIQMNPNDFEAYFGLGIAYIRLNRNQQAISPLTQCTRINPKFPDAHYNLGLVYQTLGQLEKAAGAYKQFIEVNPGPAWTGFNQLGSIYIKMGQYGKAIAAFQEVIKTNPADIKGNYNLAYAYDMAGKHEQAAPIYRKLISINPKDAKAYYNLLFRLYHKATQYDKAVEVCQEILSQFPDNANDRYNLGITYFRLENYAKALEAFRHALSLDPNFAPAYYNIGLVYFRQENYAEAIQAFKNFAGLQPDNPDAYYNIGAAYLQLKKYEEALEPLQRTIELKPDYAIAHYNLAIAYFVLKDQFSANEEYKKLISLDPQLAERLRKIIHK